ncbi:efflux RND transporter periplasmic adaptor subunit [Conchiformibius steedae]|uniref:HlyD family efflux transporter periplasmic adaptor subunit n=1 Tax=Conchiformibius steedae TaxID=153493 RepID=A0A3P2A1S4_9NEIS|nr:HlyD family efflux transporter periplasmic adaptor subunit [Conchiformibius steedae]RRD88948.1 HlyD family efflux transporter periplasmic adaptor subunit [Conchiformibius steedae]
MDNLSARFTNHIAQEWQMRLKAAGISVRACAWLNLPQLGTPDFHEKLPEYYPDALKLNETWLRHGRQLSEQQPVIMDKVGSDLLLSCLIAQSDDTPMALGCLISPPFQEQTAAVVQLGLGWLYYYLNIKQQSDYGRSARLLTLLGNVLSQSEPREAAQEWMNQTAVWAKEVAEGQDFSLLLFRVHNHVPVLQIMSGVAWLEKGSPQLHQASELAARCAASISELSEQGAWALPLQHNGAVRSVLVAHYHDSGLPEASLQIIRACAAVVEPVVLLWQQGERSLWSHFQATCGDIWAKFVRPGHLVWKAAAAATAIFLAVVLLLPVDDAVTANLYIEGGNRRVLTAPQNGYLAEVLVRPGDSVSAGQILARLEDKDLKLEQAELLSEINQSQSRFREAMATGDAAQSGIAANQKQQAQVKLDLVQSKLNRVVIRSPMTGSVVSGDWVQQIGAPVEEGKELFQIADAAEYKAILHIPDKNMDEIAIGQTGSLKLASLPEQAIRLEIIRLTAVAVVEEGQNGFQVEAKLLDAPPRLNAGMQGVAKVSVGKTNLLWLWTKNFRDWLRLKLWSWW